MASMPTSRAWAQNQIAVYDAKSEHVGIVDVPGGDTSQVIVALAVSPTAARLLPRLS